MYLNVKFNKRIYLAKVESEKYDYNFRFKDKDGNYDWYYFSFQKFKCSLNCRLNHYKDFKKRITGEDYICSRNSVLLSRFSPED